MNIGLDYDDTYTRDPIAWDYFINFFKQRGHYVHIVTWRNDLECEEIRHDLQLMHRVDGLYATARKAKEKYMYDQGIRIDVWIDDNPHTILNTMEGWE